jgi:sugar phosphate isomerase/epimerase
MGQIGVTTEAGAVSVSPLTTPAWPLESDLALHRELGLGRTSISVDKVGRAGGTSRAARLLAECGLAVDVVFPDGGLDLSRPGQWPEARASVLAAVEVAAATGGSGVLVAGGAGHGLAFEEAADRFCDAFGPVVGPAAERGVRLLLEPVRPQFAYAGFVHSVRDALPLARRLGTGVVVDVTHCWWEPGLAGALRANVDLIGSVHVADLALDRPVVHRVVPGDGELPLARLLGLLVSAGYPGPFELELIGPAIDAEGAGAAATRGVSYVLALLDQVTPHTGGT